MLLQLMREHSPEWIEAGTILLTLILGGVVSAGVTFYKVDMMSNDVKDIKSTMMMVPVVLERLENVEDDVDDLKDDVKRIDQRMYEMKHGSEETWNGTEG
jgi:hypothetical protein